MLVVALMTLAIAGRTVLAAADVSSLEPQTANQESKPTGFPELKLGEPIERELAGAEAHSYSVTILSGQCLKVAVSQKGTDVALKAFGPEGRKLTQADDTSGTGEETLFVVAETSGNYRLEVESSNQQAKTAKYEIKIEELRKATARDRFRVSAQNLISEGNQFRDQRTADSLRLALEKYQAALQLWRSVDDRSAEARALNEIGFVQSLRGEAEKALEYYNQALPLWIAAGNRRDQANTTQNIGMASLRLAKPQVALGYFEEALLLWRSVEDRQGEAITLNNMGLAYNMVSDRKKGLEYFSQSLDLRRAIGDDAGEARMLNNIGAQYNTLGEPQKALQYYMEALPLRRNFHDRRGEATTLFNIGRVYADFGDFQDALRYYNQTLLLERELGDRREEAVTLQSIAAAYNNLGEFSKALDHYNQALALNRAVKDQFNEALTLSGTGIAHLRLGDSQKALDYYNNALGLQRTVGDRYGEAHTLANIGDAYAALDEKDKALPYLEQALSLVRALGDRQNEAGILEAMARINQGLGHLDVARAQIETALDIVEATRGNVRSQDLRTSYLASKQSYYEFYIDLLMRMHEAQPSGGHDVTAFGASERVRARSLLELLTEARIDVKQGIPLDLKQRENAVHNRVSWIQSQLIQAKSRARPDQSAIAALEQEFENVDTERQQVESEIRQKHPRYANLRYPTPLNLKATQQLLDEKTVLLEYALGKNSSYLFAISKDGFLTARLPSTSMLAEQVTALRETIASGPDRRALSNYLQTARWLYQNLIEPASPLLDGKQALIIVPDGILHYLPFEVLLQSDSGRKSQVDLHQVPYLIRAFSISYSPSATVLASLRSSENLKQKPEKMFLAFGDPVYRRTENAQTSLVRSAIRNAFGEDKPWQLQPLPESRREVERIAKLYSAAQTGVFLGREATEENVKANERSSRYRFVHFAVHALLNEQKPQYSGLVLSLFGEEKKNPDIERTSTGARPESSVRPANHGNNVWSSEDGLLQVYEIFNLKLNADLVLLSACETGLGKETKGEGLVGLSQAFFYAGASSLAVSLWKVQDKSTAEMMVRFYRYLNNPSLGKAEALRRAQLEMIRSRDYSHPYYWAGFVLTGEPQ